MKFKAFVFTAILFSFSLTLFAQTSRGTVSGTVTDQAGAVVPGANITLTNLQTSISRTTTSNDEGFYRFDAVDLGTYSVGITATNFGEVTQTNITVQANQTADVPVTLQPGGQQVTVDVSANAGELLQTEAPVRGGNISPRQITELPIAGRNPVALALTLPGVVSNRGGFGVGTFSVNGARGRSNNFLIDGVENNDVGVAGQAFRIINPDAVQEVSVQTSNYDAEFGRAGGAVVNVITRGGGRDFHGTLSYLLDSRRDDALTSSEGRNPANVQRGRPPFGIENIFAGTFGGPLFTPRFGEGGRAVNTGRDRTFFFVGYDEDRQRSSAQVQLTTPTAAGRATLRQLFPAGTSSNVDVLLNSTQTSVGTASPFNIALGTVNGVNRGNVEFGTFFRNFALLSTERQFQIRIDHKLGENDQLSARYLYDRSLSPQGGTAGFEGFDADFAQNYDNFLISETHVFSPTVTNELRLAYNRIRFGFPLSDPSGPAGTLPAFNVASISSLGIDATFPQGRNANNYVVQDTATKVFGNHSFRGGIDYLHQITTDVPPQNTRGSLNFNASNGFTALGNFVDNFGGSSGSANRTFGNATNTPGLNRTALFFQDRYKASEALTLTLGVRYERFGTPFNAIRTIAFTGLFNVNPATLTGPFSQPNSVPADKNNFAPTIGVAYSPSFTNGFMGRLFGEKKTVFRAGYQIGYDSFFNNISSNAATSSPNVIATTTPSTVSAANPRGLPNLSSQLPTVAGALSPLSSQTLIAPDLVNPYYQRYSAGFQRELPYKLVLDLAYVGSKGTKLFINEDANPLVRPELRVTPAGFTGATSGRLDNIQGARTVRTNGGSSSYNSGQIEVRRRFANNLTATGSYTYSKLLDNQSEVFAPGGQTSTSFFALPAILGGDRFERGPSVLDRTHRAVFTYVYEIPFLREQRGFIGRALGGFQISGVTTFESGVPFTVFNGLDSDGIGGGLERPNFNPNGQRGVRAIPVVNAQGFITGYTNPDAGNAPIDPNTAQFIVNPAFTAGLAGSVPRFGSLGRNTERGPGTRITNLNLFKKTRISESKLVEFRTEFFNVFNHPNFLQGSVSPFSPGGGAISANATTTLPGRFLNPDTPATDGGGRVIRYQIKLIF
ncbi:MAG: carboxypeptidase regulatory-like domain-containing protein [Pyrinomonadaceae bacterium]